MKTLITFLFACCFGSAMAQSNLPPCQGEERLWTDCFGTTTLGGGLTYVGDYQDGKPDGQGKHTFSDGSEYVGEFKDGKYHGQGTYNHASGYKYVGEFKNGSKHGQGKYTFANGTEYAGGFRRGHQSGQGTIFYASGDTYIGDWWASARNGQGVITYANGDKYTGSFQSNLRAGFGTYTYSNGAKYVGAWSADQQSGLGAEFNADGTLRRSGYFENGVFRSEEKSQATSALAALKKLQLEARELKLDQKKLEDRLKVANEENPPDCAARLMIFSDGRESCTSSYSTVTRGDVGLRAALTSELNEKFYAFATNTILGGGGGFGGAGARFHGSGRSQKSLAQASRIAVKECESVRSRLVPFVSGNTTFKRTDECVLLISAEPAGPLNVNLAEAEFHKTWPSDQLIYTRNVEMYGEEYAKSQLSEPPLQVQATAKPELSELEIALAEAEQAKSRQAELETQLAAAQPQTQIKPTAQIAPQGKRVALVIGNAKYKFSPLNNPVNDATDMAASLRSVGFDVIEIRDANKRQMRAATRRFEDKLATSDVGLVYYSGHGVEVKGRNYLIPVDADIRREHEVEDQAFDAGNILRMMESLQGTEKKRVNIMIVDACRNNDLARSWRSTNRGLARMDAPTGSFISFATAPGQVASDGNGRNSPFTKHLLQALKQPNVPIELVFKEVRRNVMAETGGEQVPWENSSLVGDFYFTVAR